MKSITLKKLTAVFLSCVLTFSTLPIAFSRPSTTFIFSTVTENSNESGKTTLESLTALYADLELDQKGLSQEAFSYGVKGYLYLRNHGKISNDGIISIADFTKSSTKKRFFIIDLNNQEILFNTYVAHGQNTGQEYAKAFSNNPESYQSSMGFYVTSGTYNGKNGYSMQLMGQEYGFNDKANARAIVMHGAPYVSESFIKSRGFLGRSWGCPAVPESLNRPIIEKIKNGSCLFIFNNDNNYLSKSKILNS